MWGWRTGRSRRARDAARFAAPIAPPLWPPLSEPMDASDALVDALLEEPGSLTDPAVIAQQPQQPFEDSASVPVVGAQLEMQAEFLRLLEVVTSMCDHVIEYIESDRAERRVMVETLTDLGRVITDGAAAVVVAAAVPMIEPGSSDARSGEAGGDDEQFVDARERVIGGSMPAGPEPIIDLVEPERAWDPAPSSRADPAPLRGLTAKDAAVEVRGRIGDRWVDGFEICEVMTTAAGPRYRLRRRLDGVVLPELFEASSIRHVEASDHHASESLDETTNDETTNDEIANEHMASDQTAADGTANDVNDRRINAPPQYWSRS